MSNKKKTNIIFKANIEVLPRKISYQIPVSECKLIETLLHWSEIRIEKYYISTKFKQQYP